MVAKGGSKDEGEGDFGDLGWVFGEDGEVSRLRFYALLGGVIVLLLIGAVWLVKLRGDWEWEATRKELVAKGEKLTMAELAPPEVGDERNFFGDAMWREIVEKREKTAGDWEVIYLPAVRKDMQQLSIFWAKLPGTEIAQLKEDFPKLADSGYGKPRSGVLNPFTRESKEKDEAVRKDGARFVLAVLKPEEAMLGRISELLKRPEARFPLDYTDVSPVNNFPHVVPVLYIGQAYTARALAEIQLGQSEAAFRDALDLIGLSHTTRGDPFVLSQAVRATMVGYGLGVIRVGIAAEAWTDAELITFDEKLKEEDFLPDLLKAMRGERAATNLLAESFEMGGPKRYELMVKNSTEWEDRDKGTVWDRQMAVLWMRAYLPMLMRFDQAYSNRLIQEMIDALVASSWKGMMAKPLHEAPAEYRLPFFRLTHRFTVSGASTWYATMMKLAYTQDIVGQARIACGLERYYLAKKEYPESLEALVPEYMSAVPGDILTGTAMHYKRTEPGAFLLWANGWDGRDNGGRKPERGKHDGDWVWGKP
ncbi:hypothetical protein BH09VER1_BH09VER1_54930 [soil metagenome]